MRRVWQARLFVVSVAALVATGLAASAQQDERVKALIAKAQASMREPGTAFLRIESTVTVNGQRQADEIQELWVRDLEHFRMEKTDGTILTVTPDDVKMVHGPSKVALHIPKETMEKLGDKRDEEIARAGVGLPGQMMRLLAENGDSLQITGEDTIGEEACWVLSVTEEGLKKWGPFLGGGGDAASRLVSLQIALGKDTGVFRGVSVEVDAEVRVEILQKVTDIQPDVEVADAMLTFETPPGAQVIEWAPGEAGADVGKRFRQTIAAAMAKPKQ
jgi:hypothetical protein